MCKSKLSDVVNDNVVKTSVYEKVVTKIIAVYHTELCKKLTAIQKLKKIEERIFSKILIF